MAGNDLSHLNNRARGGNGYSSENASAGILDLTDDAGRVLGNSETD
jgi:hypothetical protein